MQNYMSSKALAISSLMRKYSLQAKDKPSKDYSLFDLEQQPLPSYLSEPVLAGCQFLVNGIWVMIKPMLSTFTAKLR
jgi:hypothetical protein